ncbi:MAG: DUF4198 domain-containing protein [Bryobacter sp.]|jgi:uncharacterized GH25 family protein|nr:DUF4198 domain-containing protein [Bryobacter sp.]
MRKSVLLISLAAPLLGHDMYLLPQRFRTEPGVKLLVAIHNGDSFPQSEGPVEPQRLSSKTLGEFLPLAKATHAFAMIREPGVHVFAVSTALRRNEDLAAKAFDTYLKEEGLDHVIAARAKAKQSGEPGREIYSKHAKTLVVAGAANEGWKTVLGLPIEFVPETDPSQLRPGSQLPVRVLWRGKPAAGLQVEKAWEGGHAIVGRTDAQGRITVPLEQKGRWRLHAVAIERCAEPRKADWESYWASFTFAIE